MQVLKIQSRYEMQLIPAQVQVIEHQEPVMVCQHCEASGVITPIETLSRRVAILSNSSASAESIAWLINQKYNLGLPLYRIEKALAQQKHFPLSRQTMSHWLMRTAERYRQPLYEHMKPCLLKSQHLHADETAVQVLREPGRKASRKSYMWLYRSGWKEPPILLYQYTETRLGSHPNTV